VGAAFAAIAQRREVFEHIVLADVALERAQTAVEAARASPTASAPSASMPPAVLSSSS